MIDAEGRALGVTTANWLDAPYNRWGFRNVPDLVRTATISRGAGPVRELPRAERDLGAFAFEHEGRTYTLPEMLAETSTDGFLVVHDGIVVDERYLGGMRETDTHLLMSCSKSLTSMLCGVLAGRGLLAPTDFDVDEYTIIDVSDYRTHDVTGTIPADTASWIRSIGPGEHAHGEGPFRYCSLATDVLGWVLSRVGGAPFPEVFSRELWSRIGAERDAEIMLDHAGFAIVEGGICTTLRDLARFGLLCLEDGRVGDEQVAPADWIARVRIHDADLIDAFRASDRADPLRPDAFYHDKWWVDDGPRGVYAGLGMNGQSIFVHRPARTVIAKFSTFEDALDWDRFALHHAGMVALCEHLD
jgi:hypothetical protein